MTKGTKHDSPILKRLLKHMPKGSGEFCADSAYDMFIVRGYLRMGRIKAQIPRRSRKRHRGRPPSFDEAAYRRHKSSVEKFFSMLKGDFRRFAIRLGVTHFNLF